MPELNNQNVLLRTGHQCASEQLFEEHNVFTKITDSGKLWLEAFPDVMALERSSLFVGEQNCISDHIVIFFRIFVECANFVALAKSIDLFVTQKDLELALALVVRDFIKVRKFDVLLDTGRGRRVQVVQCTLGHFIKHFVEFVLLNLWLHFVEIL